MRGYVVFKVLLVLFCILFCHSHAKFPCFGVKINILPSSIIRRNGINSTSPPQ